MHTRAIIGRMARYSGSCIAIGDWHWMERLGSSRHLVGMSTLVEIVKRYLLMVPIAISF